MLRATLKLLELAPVPRIWEWAELRRRLGKNVTAKPGRYSVATAPYQKEWQESFVDPDVQVTVLYCAKRLGKTETVMNLIGWVVEHVQRNILIVFPTLEMCMKWSKQFLTPMIQSTQVLTERFSKAKSRDGQNTMRSKQFIGGTLAMVGTNTATGFRQVQAPIVFCDDIDLMENTSEGDPVTLAFGRAENYSDSIQIVASTATELIPPKDGQDSGTGSRIHDWWLKSDQRKWFVPCGCGKWHVLAWSQVKWPSSDIDGHKPEAAHYETPCCGAKWGDYDRLKSICAGEWRPTAPFKGIRGYWLNGLNTTFPAKKGYKTKLHQFAAEFLDAYISGEAARIAWKNTFLCEPHEQAAERVEASPLLNRCEKYSEQTLPNEIVLIGASVDVQGDRLEYEIIGMGDGEETWGVQFDKIIGDPEKEPVWNDLKARLAQKFKRVDGIELPITCTAIDLGHKPKQVRKFIKTCGLPRVYGVYGSSAGKKQINLVTPRLNKFYRSWSYSVNTALAKDTIFARLKMKEAGPRYMHWHEGYDKDYFEGLTAEEKRVRYSHGFPETYYEKIRTRNEPLDLRVYFLAAMDILKPNIELIRKSIERPASQKDYVIKEPEKSKPEVEKKKPFVAPRHGGFVKGWKH